MRNQTESNRVQVEVLKMIPMICRNHYLRLDRKNQVCNDILYNIIQQLVVNKDSIQFWNLFMFSVVSVCIYHGIHIGYFGIDDIAPLQIVTKLSICDARIIEGKESVETGERFWARPSNWSWSRLGTNAVCFTYTRVNIDLIFFCT